MNYMNEEDEMLVNELWDHYSELPNPMWYEYKRLELEKEFNKNLTDE